MAFSVHPRGHGEHIRSYLAACLHTGSSPWARGTHVNQFLVVTGRRFIPVGTGNTESTVSEVSSQAVHPRGHGEHIHLSIVAMGMRGSSPWARGTHIVNTPGNFHARFIPVGTGNTESVTLL